MLRPKLCFADAECACEQRFSFSRVLPRGLDDSQIVQAHGEIGMVRAGGFLQNDQRFPDVMFRGFEAMLVMQNAARDG